MAYTKQNLNYDIKHAHNFSEVKSLQEYLGKSIPVMPGPIFEMPTLGIATHVLTIRGRDALLFEGRRYTLNYKGKNGWDRWRCSGRVGTFQCKGIATIISMSEGEVGHVLTVKGHTCGTANSKQGGRGGE